jgi:hypothetical protein
MAEEKKTKKKKLEEWFEDIHKNFKTAEAAGASIGACLLSDPAGGISVCVQVDEDTCKSLKGVFLGGACP